jgi:hypothetical protein
MSEPRQSPRSYDDMDTKFREIPAMRTRTFFPLTGVPSSPDANRVYEYGRLRAMHFFLSGDARTAAADDDRAREELGITDAEERIARNVTVVYKYLEYQNRRDFEAIVSIHHEPYLNKTYFGRWPISPLAHVRGLQGWFRIVPDATTEANKIIAATEEKVVIRTTARGTQVKSFPNSMLGAAGKQWAVALIHAIEVSDEQIASCEGTSPFENQYEEPFINSNFPGLGGDVSEVRARQGVNADFEYLAAQIIDDTSITRMYRGVNPEAVRPPRDDVLTMIKELYAQGPRQCQTLLPPKMRRCTKLRVGDSLYCLYHQSHGYGIDDEY